MTERRYSEDEVALILRRAVEPSALEQDGGPGTGTSLAELKEIGAEAGIDAARIEEAARELARRPQNEVSSPLAESMGFPPTVQEERVVPVRLAEDQLPQMLDLVRSEFSRQGLVDEVLGGFEWRARSVMGGRYVSIRGDGDSTRVRVLGNYRDGLLTFVLGPGPLLGILGGFVGAGLGGGNPLAVGAVAVAGWATSLIPWRLVFKRERRALRRVLDGIERRLRDTE